MSRDLRDARVLLTGASTGIGREAARRLGRHRARVALVARDEDALRDAAAEIEEAGGRAHVLVRDLAEDGAPAAVVDEAAAQLGGLDVVVLNAAAASFGAFTETPREDVERTVRIVFTATADALRAALPHLERSGGVLVAVGSTASRMPIPKLAAYAAAKHALRGLLGSVRIELREAGSPVRIAMVHPGPVDTPFWRTMTSPEGWLPPVPPFSGDAGEVADAIVAAARDPRDEVLAGSRTGRLTPRAWALAPQLADRALALGIRVMGHVREAPAGAGRLWRAGARR